MHLKHRLRNGGYFVHGEMRGFGYYWPIGNRNKTKGSIMGIRLAMWHNRNLKTLRMCSLPGHIIRNKLLSHRHDLRGDTFNFGYIIPSNIHWPVAMKCSRYRWVDSFVMHEWTDGPWTTGLDNQILVIVLRTCTMDIILDCYNEIFITK